jgi:hypothetical protein
MGCGNIKDRGLPLRDVGKQNTKELGFHKVGG